LSCPCPRPRWQLLSCPVDLAVIVLSLSSMIHLSCFSFSSLSNIFSFDCFLFFINAIAQGFAGEVTKAPHPQQTYKTSPSHILGQKTIEYRNDSYGVATLRGTCMPHMKTGSLTACSRLQQAGLSAYSAVLSSNLLLHSLLHELNWERSPFPPLPVRQAPGAFQNRAADFSQQ
jgi:hypothetical protein